MYVYTCVCACIYIYAHVHIYIHGVFIGNGVKWMRLAMHIESRNHITSCRDEMGRKDDRFIEEKHTCREIGRERMEG